MAAARFVVVSDDDVNAFSEQQENDNTKKKTLYDLKIFREFLETCDEKREIENITPVELRAIIKKFVLAVRKKNGDEYEPSSIRAFLQSIDRYLRKNNYGFSVLNDKEFHEVQDILKKKQKQLKSIGKGNRPNAADPLSDEDIATFYSCGVLGIDSPRALLNVLWLNNCIYFGMRPGKEQRDLCWGDLQLKTDSEGNRFVEFSKERQTRTRTGENPRSWGTKNLKCTKTRTTQIAVLLILTWPTKITVPQTWWPMNLLSILLLISKARNQVKNGLRWLYTISSVFAGSDIYFFLMFWFFQLRENISVQT